MNLQSLLYRMEPVVAIIENGLFWRPPAVWRDRDRRQKLLVISLGFMLIIGVCHAAVAGIKHSQTAFFKRNASIIQLNSGSDRATSVKPTRLKPLTTVHTIPVESPPSLAQSVPSSLPPYLDVGDPLTEAQAMGRAMSAARFGDQHWDALYKLWHAESGWNPGARNRSSGACGIPQALPCNKIPDMSLRGQLEWGINYIGERYGNPTNAWRFWDRHNWY